MEDLVTVVRLGMSSVFFWAGLEKTRNLTSIPATMRQLGVPPGLARAAAWFLVGGELTVAVGLTFQPGSAGTLVGVLVLSTAFAVVGLIALRRDEAIHCGCFGPGAGGYVGMPQVVAYPVWLAGTTLLWLEAPAHLSVRSGAASLALVGLTLGAVRCVTVVKIWRVARADRQSAQEMLTWLRW